MGKDRHAGQTMKAKTTDCQLYGVEKEQRARGAPSRSLAMKKKLSNPSDQDIWSAWQGGLSEASKNPRLRQQRVQQQGELLPRFAKQYQMTPAHLSVRLSR
jgi:hypothetical protein